MKLKLKPTESRGTYTAQINGKDVVVALTERNRAKQDFVNNSVNVSKARIRRALALAGNKPLYVAVSVTVKNTFAQAFAMPVELWRKLQGGAHDFLLSDSNREVYAKNDAVLKGWEPSIFEPEFAGPPQPKPAKKGKTARKSAK